MNPIYTPKGAAAEYGELAINIYTGCNHGSLMNALNGRGGFAIEKIDSTLIKQVLWAMAKTADRSIADFETWLETFDDFPIIDLIGITRCIGKS